MSFHRARLGRLALCGLAALSLAACQTAPKDEKPALIAASEVPLDVRIQDARSRLAANDQAGALSRLHEAARLHPGSAQPWSVIAQIQFDAGNYGAAIVAAQEVLARDATDTAANNVIAVAGLRSAVSAIALLRRVDGIHGSARQESETLAERLRESLGLPVLVPPPVVQAAKPAPPAPRRRAPTAAAAARSAEASAAGNTGINGTAPKPAVARDPFGSLK